MHKKLKHKIEIETNQQINFLDRNIYRETNTFNLGIFRKPTYTDIVIPKSSNHPNNHKQSASNYLLDRAHKIPIPKEEKEKMNKTNQHESNIQSMMVHKNQM
jgi:hypothetical protein